MRNTNPMNQTPLNTSVNWQYFFGASNGRSSNRYYKAEINGMRVEKHSSSRGVKYAIGNIDEAKTKYKTEKELIDACLNKTITP
jgi:hypothetical protein